jgi:CheY-like chemotaxis protein
MARARILVIEDNSSEVFLLRRALLAMKGEDFELEVASDGEAALQFIHRRGREEEDYPCVIVLDLHLPKHDGLEILREIRCTPILADVPVLVTTNGVSPKEAEELRKMGADYRLKPRNLAEFAILAADLVTICNGHRARLQSLSVS